MISYNVIAATVIWCYGIVVLVASCATIQRGKKQKAKAERLIISPSLFLPIAKNIKGIIGDGMGIK